MKRRVGFLDSEKIIFQIDFSELKDEKLLEYALFTNVEVKKLTKNTSFFIDVTGTKVTFEVFQYILDASKQIQPLVVKSAVVGIKGFNKFLFRQYCNLTGSGIKSFDKREQAINYLSNN